MTENVRKVLTTYIIREKKLLPEDYKTKLYKFRVKRGHRESDIEVEGANGNSFRLITRQNNSNPHDFSIILAYPLPDKNKEFLLKRYNGKHIHSNRIEGDQLHEFHIHIATERYQEIGANEESYAEMTNKYRDFNTALRFAFQDANFVRPESEQRQKSFDL